MERVLSTVDKDISHGLVYSDKCYCVGWWTMDSETLIEHCHLWSVYYRVVYRTMSSLDYMKEDLCAYVMGYAKWTF